MTRYVLGCSKVPDLSGVGLIKDRATLRISSQHSYKPLSAEGSFGVAGGACADFRGRDAAEWLYRAAAARLSREGQGRFSALMRVRVVVQQARR